MWTNISGVVGAAIQKVQKIQNEIESQLDEAVGKDRPEVSSEQIKSTSVVVDSSNHSDPHLNESVGSGSSKSAEEADIAANDATEANEQKPGAVTKKPATKKVRVKSKSSPSPSSSSPTNESGVESSAPAESAAAATPHFVDHVPKAELETLRSEHAEQLRKIESKHKKELLAQQQDAQQARDEAAQRRMEAQRHHDESVQDMRNQLAGLQRQHESDREAWQTDTNARLSTLRAECADRVAQCLPVATPTANGSDADLAALTAQLDDAKYRCVQAEEQLREDTQRLSGEVQRLRDELLQVRDQAHVAQLQLRRDHERDRERAVDAQNQTQTELTKLREVIADRERALEAAHVRLSEVTHQLDLTTSRLGDLQTEVSEKDKAIKSAHAAFADDSELKKQLQRLLDEAADKDTKLAAFESEGTQLAKRQAEMEKNIRKNRAELKEKDAEVTKLKESRDQLMRAIEQTQDVLRKAESDNATSAKAMAAMQAVSAASADKISKLEAEGLAKSDELATQRRALENAWADGNELKKVIAELKAERDDLKKQLGEGTSRALETESTKRDVEQREAVLRATSRQLEETLKQQMAEAAQREERLRAENQNMQKKWQEAVMSREQLANELAAVTTPLLRQISALQDQLRAKSDQFIAIETALNERVLKAENSLDTHEHRRGLLDEQIAHLKAQLASVSAQYKDCQERLASSDAQLERLRRLETTVAEDRRAAESKLAYEQAQTKSLQAALRELEIKHKVDLHEAAEQLAHATAQHSAETARLRSELSALGEQLKVEKFNSKLHKSGGRVATSAAAVAAAATGREMLPRLAEDDSAQDSLLSPTLPNGEVSFVAAEKQQQRLRQRDDELSSLQMQVSKLEMSRSALLEEVSFLSERNAQLEEDLHAADDLRGKLSAVDKQRDVLLALLGEKEEELEAAWGDLSEVKAMYQAHIQELLATLAPPSAAAEAGAGGSPSRSTPMTVPTTPVTPVRA